MSNENPAVHVQLTYFEPTPLPREFKLEGDVYALQKDRRTSS